MKIVEGEEQVTPGPARGGDADTIRGQGWIARAAGGRHLLEYDAGEIQSRETSLEITADEFARLRRDPAQFLPIVHAHGG